MRTATLVGLGAIPLGLLGIVLFGTGSAALVILVGVFVGFVYSDRPTPAYRAGARAGLFAAVPEAVVQPAGPALDVWTWGASTGEKVFFGLLFGVVGFLFLWVVGAVFCIASAAVTEAVVDGLRERRSNAADRSG